MRCFLPGLFTGIFAVSFFCIFNSCKSDSNAPESENGEPTLTASNPLLELTSPEQTGVTFENVILETPESNITNNINVYNGGGLAIADINNDGLPDIYFIGTTGPNKMYLNEGNFKFKDITESAGLTAADGFETAVTAADVNGDGLLDFYVCRSGSKISELRKNKLFINNGDLSFSEKSAEYGLNDISSSTGAVFLDFDLDGDLDLYLLNNPADLTHATKAESKPGPDGSPIPNNEPKTEYDTDRFYRNDGGRFTDVSKEVGVWNFGWGLSVSVSDFNFDGYPDIYVGNDFFQSDYLYINNGNGSFSEQLKKYFKHTTLHTMGTTIADFDNDGLVDLYALDMLPDNNYRKKTILSPISTSRYLTIAQNGYMEPVVHNVLQRNNGNGTFSEIGCMSGVYKTDWSWSGLLMDLDNDGRKDLHVTNGYRREITNADFFEFNLQELTTDLRSGNKTVEELIAEVPEYKVRNYVFQNNSNWEFVDKGGNWMTMKGSWSCGAAWADFDADGDLDLIISNLEEPAFLYKNLAADQQKGNYLQIKLKGDDKNAFCVGGSALIEYGNERQYMDINPTQGIFSAVEHLIHFGLGDQNTIDKLSVRWPDGKTLTMENVQANQRLELSHEQASGASQSLVKPRIENAYFEPVNGSGVNFRHTENQYVDFEAFPMNPWKETDLGPMIAVGDANGDGLEDFYIGNSFNSPGALYIQQGNGRFSNTSTETWDSEKGLEDHGAVFFDFDGDKDQDLYIVGGGAECPPTGRNFAWQGRLYVNTDGKGTYRRVAPQHLPDVRVVGQRISAFDYDNDGDEDLFMGGRVQPDKWPMTPLSMVFRNDGNKLKNVSAPVAGDLARSGMVTDLQWTDLDGDGTNELVVVGEWMPVSIFKMQGKGLKNVTSQYGLEKSNGIWNRLAIADLDNDGDMDLVTGNLGLNTRFIGSADAPMRVYASDYDQNGTIDPLVTTFENGKEFPFVDKTIITKQMPVLKKKFLYSKDYARATIQDIWSEKELEEALILNCYTVETCWWENRNGKFIRHAFPRQVQASPIMGILVSDFNGDGNPDILMAGNKYGMEVESGHCDAGTGVLLTGDGTGNFKYISNLESGFWAMGEVRDLALIHGPGNRRFVVVSNNNGPAQIYRTKF